MDKEIWKDIIGYENYYQVSSLGRIRSCERHVKVGIKHNKTRIHLEKIVKPIKLKTGYYTVGLSKEGKEKTKTIHRIVAETFIPNLKNKTCVNHINGNKSDNRVENLEWCDYKCNNCHAHKTGLNKGPIKKINQYDLQGNYIRTWNSITEAQNNLKINNISMVCRELRKTAGGFIWRYANEQ